jgi:acetyl esterase/lipase
MMAAIPVPADVTTSSGSLGGIPVVNVEAAGADHASVIFYLHGGAYAIGTAASSILGSAYPSVTKHLKDGASSDLG